MTVVTDRFAGRIFLGRIVSVRLLVPALALVISVAIHAALNGAAAPLSYLLCAGAGLGLVLLGLVAANRRALVLGALLSSAAVFAIPLLPAIASGRMPGDVLHGSTVWPQCLVLLFASRLLAEVNRLRSMDFWRLPVGAPPSAQSFSAAMLLGLCVTLLFYSQLGLPADAPAHEPLAVFRRALAAPSVLHAAILALFLTLLAAILDAALALRWEERLLRRFRDLLDDIEPDQAPLQLIIQASEILPASSRVRAAFVAVLAQSQMREEPALEAVHAASRRFMRTLLSFLPLLGFLGTVVGLSIAIAGLDSRVGQAAGVDLAASLAGLSLQFETTLLGLLGGLLGALAIALVDKREAELLASARHLAAGCLRRGGA
ncbi:MAG: MotA/TolQ/ExbB proton channel family protein [Allorhizobium sp.]